MDSPLDLLTQDLLLEITLRLDSAKELCNLSLVSHLFRQLAGEQVVWRHLCFTEWHLTSGPLIVVLR